MAGGGAGACSGQGPGHRPQAGPLGNHGGQDRAKGFGSAGGGGFRFGVLLQGAGATAAQLDATGLGGGQGFAGALGDPAARTAVQAQRAREDFGNVRRVHREVLHQLDQVAATTTATAELTRRLDELERIRARLEVRLDALEKRVT